MACAPLYDGPAMPDQSEPVTFSPEPEPQSSAPKPSPAGSTSAGMPPRPEPTSSSGTPTSTAGPPSPRRSRDPGLRRTIRLLAQALLVYGVISLALAIGGGIAAWRLGDELRASASALEEDIASVQQTLETSAAALKDVADTAEAFAPTLDLVEGPLQGAATTVGTAATTMDGLAGTLAAFQVFGLRPFESVAADIADTADGLAALADDLGDLSTTLPDVGNQLDRNVASLRELSVELGTLAEGIASGRVVEALHAAIDLVVALSWILAAWLGLLAVGSLVFGLLLWRIQAPRPSSAT